MSAGAISHCRRRLVAFLGLLALAGCSSAPTAHPADNRQVEVFSQAYGDISKYYIEAVTPGALAVAGLHHLSTIDTALSVEKMGDEVVLHRGADAVRFPAPAAADAEGWGDVTAAMLKAARERSAAVAALPSDREEEAVLAGSLGLLDRFSHYSPPEVAQERRASRDGFGGIGVTLDAEGADARIVEVMPDTPAAEAGLRVNDRIVAIDGVETAALPREEVIHRLRGPTDSVIALAVARTGVGAPIAVSMHRARIVPPSVVLTELTGIAVLRISSFNQQTAQSLADLLRQAHRDMGRELHGIILDLRGNPGGLLDQSIDVASQFLDGSPVSSTIGRVADSIQHYVAPHREVETLPLAVLVNGGSASASEIVAAALQDTGRAVIVGSASYGKGTVQNVRSLVNDGELTITWARLMTPGGYVLHEHGVVPTVCTADLPDNTDGITAALARSAGALHQRRASLDEAAWHRLREACPGQREDHWVEMHAAERLLAEPALYARALRMTPVAAARPVATAGVTR